MSSRMSHASSSRKTHERRRRLLPRACQRHLSAFFSPRAQADQRPILLLWFDRLIPGEGCWGGRPRSPRSRVLVHSQRVDPRTVSLSRNRSRFRNDLTMKLEGSLSPRPAAVPGARSPYSTPFDCWILPFQPTLAGVWRSSGRAQPETSVVSRSEHHPRRPFALADDWRWTGVSSRHAGVLERVGLSRPTWWSVCFRGSRREPPSAAPAPA